MSSTTTEPSVWGLFDATVDAIPDAEAVVWRQRRLSYAQLRDRALRFAGVLDHAGLGRHAGRASLQPWQSGQDLVASYLLNGPEYLEVMLGSFAASAAPFNVNYRYVADEMTYLFNDASTAAIVYHARFAPVLASVLPRLRREPSVLLQVADGSGVDLLDGARDYETALSTAPPPAAPLPSPDDLYVLYTGGTTGMPKGTLWRQADVWEAALGGDRWEGADKALAIAVSNAARGRHRFLPNAPLMHGAAQWIALRMLLMGGAVIVNDTVDRLDPDEVWEVVERERVDTTLMVGEAMARPLAAALVASQRDVAPIRSIFVGGAATSPETKQRLLGRLPAARIVELAGATETGSALTSISAQGDDAPEMVFDAKPDVAVLNADRTGLLEPGSPEAGWFAKRGRIPLGYLGDEAKTSATFPTIDGVRWAVPGDRARWLADGRVQLLGRDSVTINTGGEKVYAEEVEAALLRHPGVSDVVVVGRPSARWGEEVVALVALRDDPGDAALVATASDHLARYKVPKSIVRVTEIRRSPAGKPDYRWARDAAAEAG